MAAKLSKLVALTIVSVLLLSGCSNNQAASTDVGRPDLSGEQTAAVQDTSKQEETVSEPAAPEQQNMGESIPTEEKSNLTEDAQGAAGEDGEDQDGKKETTEGTSPGEEVNNETEKNEADNNEESTAAGKEDNPPVQQTAAETEQESSTPTDANQENSGPTTLKFSELYSAGSSRGLKFSDKLTSLAGKKVVMNGFMAPPLKPALTFFVLTREPMAVCPFCNSDANWPEDIVLVYMPQGKEVPPMEGVIKVTGTLDIGSYTDQETGFVSQVRIHADQVERVQ